MELLGKTALVTGGSRGIGRAVCVRLAEMGAKVVVNYRSDAGSAAGVVSAIEAAGGSAVAVQADIAVRGEVLAMMESVGQVDVLVNNAGVLVKGDLGDFDFSQMDSMRSVNVDGLVHCSRGVIDGMKAAGWGRIINVSSIAAFGTGMPGTTFYAATKAAVLALTRRFAMELGPFGITVNAVAPGSVVTDMTAGFDLGPIAAKAMVRRVGSPEDIGHAVGFLASVRSGFITAQTLTVDGGRMDYIGRS